jgi:DUF1680 family protein
MYLAARSDELVAANATRRGSMEGANRFPYFTSVPVPYVNVRMQDEFWAPRQRVVREVTVPWATRHFDTSGGLDAFRAHPQDYRPSLTSGDLEAIKFIEAMAAVIGQGRDPAMEGLAEAWGKEMRTAQGADGYWWWGWPTSREPAQRWKPVWWSHEDYSIGHYLESGLAFKEATGRGAIYDSSLKAVNNMAETFLSQPRRAYAPGHSEIEQALMRLYGETGDSRYLRLAGWLIGRRGHYEGEPADRRSFHNYSQDHAPVEQQRTIEGHAVRAGFLFNGVTEYVGATGDKAYREAVLAVWQNFVEHKMYLHGGGGRQSTQNEGYSSEPDALPPNDCYGESCSVFANFQWAHNLFRLTGEAQYIDTAERMLYNAFYASLSLSGDRYFYGNVMEKDEPTLRFEWHVVPCCPPNIVKLFTKVGGFFYSTDRDGIFIKHYGASEARIPFGSGVTLTQRSRYPWDGDIEVRVDPAHPTPFTLRLRAPAWAFADGGTPVLSINGKPASLDVDRGWLSVRRTWQAGDRVNLSLPMPVRRVTMPARFKGYEGRVAFERGPIVYCLEGVDVPAAVQAVYAPADHVFTAEHRPDLLGGVTVLKGMLARMNFQGQAVSSVPAQLVPYGVWNNRGPSLMRVWLQGAPYESGEPPLDPPVG